MSRHRKHRRPPAAAPVEPSAPSPADAAVVAAPPLRERLPRPTRATLLGAALLLLGAWWAALIGMAGWTANPVQLNFEQYSLADYVVLARDVDLSTGRLVIVRELARAHGFEALAPGPLVVENLAEIRPLPKLGETYIVPLTERNDAHHVAARLHRPADPRRPFAPPEITPWSPAAERELARILGQLRQLGPLPKP